MEPNTHYSYQPEQESVFHLPHKKVLFGLIGLVVLVVIAIFAMISNRSNQKDTSTVVPTPSSVILDSLQDFPKKEGEYYSSAASPALKTPPKTQFTYTLDATPPVVPPNATVYLLASNLTQQQATTIAQKFGSFPNAPQPIGLNNYFFFDEQQTSQVIIYGNSGSIVGNFNPQTTSITSITSNAQAQEKAQAFLQSVGLWEDQFLSPMGNPYPKNPVVYKKGTYPNRYFVEFHRGWMQLPIINHIGMLNDTFKNSLANPKKSLAPNKNVTYSSDGLAGYERSDSFNTVTIGVRTDGFVEYLHYYIRGIQSQKSVSLKPFQDALNELMQGTATDTLIYPTGKLGSKADYTEEEWQALFPGGVAISKDAVVDDVQLAYNEKPITEAQTTMKPYYIFRGRAVLGSGKIVNFVSLVNATSSSQPQGLNR